MVEPMWKMRAAAIFAKPQPSNRFRTKFDGNDEKFREKKLSESPSTAWEKSQFEDQRARPPARSIALESSFRIFDFVDFVDF